MNKFLNPVAIYTLNKEEYAIILGVICSSSVLNRFKKLAHGM
jgi:hypothetical protein